MITHKAKCDICGAMKEVPTYSDWDCPQCGQGYTYDEGHQILLTDAQRALLRNQPRWIPVAERLPDYSDTVWAFDGTDVVLCEHWLDSGFHTLGSSCDSEGLNSETLYGITHWMDVEEPAPPEVTHDRR